MPFSETDLDTILAATGEDVVIMLNGVVAKTIKGKFRKDFLEESPFEAHVGILKPAVTVKTSDLVGVTNSHSFIIQSVEYKYDGKPEGKNSGFTLVKLGLKK